MKRFILFFLISLAVACQQIPSPKDDSLYKAAEQGDIARIAKLLQKGYDVNFVCKENCQGWTPVMIATTEGHADAVRFLLEHGADPNAQNQLGRTALHFAVKYGFQPITEALLEYGADPLIQSNDPNSVPRTAVQIALHSIRQEAGGADEQKFYDILKLLSYRASEADSEFEDNTPLVQAYIHNDYDFAKYLLDHGANPNRISTVKMDDLLYHEVEDYTSDERLKALIKPYKVAHAKENFKLLQKQGIPNLYKLKHGIDHYFETEKKLPDSPDWVKYTGILAGGSWNESFTQNDTPQFRYTNHCSALGCMIRVSQYYGGHENYRINLVNTRMWTEQCVYAPESQLGKWVCGALDKSRTSSLDAKERVMYHRSSSDLHLSE